MKRKLTNQEIKLLLENAEFSLDDEKYEQALSDYTMLINNSNPLPSYYRNRALVYDRLFMFSKSIEDVKAAIQLDPDDSANYWMLGGYLVSNEMLAHGKLTDPSSKSALEAAANNYKISLEKDPTNECAWLNIIEINLFTNNWDDAICCFGSCKTFVKSLPFKLIRSFLGGLAVVLSGEEIDNEDLRILNDLSIRISNNHYRVCEIESLILELELSGFNISQINYAKKILKLFLAHYEDEPRRYGKY